MNKILIKPSKIVKDQTYGFKNVSREELLHSTQQHIRDVRQGIAWFMEQFAYRAKHHDFTKLKYFNDFYKDFVNNFKTNDWFQLHKNLERHHIADPEGQHQDIDLIDVIEYIVDTVMAGFSRNGSYYMQQLSPELLEMAYINTVQKLLRVIELQKS